ncbi:unnamed protein product, partial [Polarella glacialis]
VSPIAAPEAVVHSDSEELVTPEDYDRRLNALFEPSEAEDSEEEASGTAVASTDPAPITVSEQPNDEDSEHGTFDPSPAASGENEEDTEDDGGNDEDGG